MAKVILRWKLFKFAKMITATLLNKFDCFIVIEGGTGIGKSTLALQIANQVAKEFKKLYSLDEETLEYYFSETQTYDAEDFIKIILGLKEEKAYNFRVNENIVYNRTEMQKLLSSWHQIGISDEMINTAHNRDFWNEDQKNIVKMINMFRDHQNLIIACIPHFNVMDNQMKNLCKIRLSVIRRGLAIIQMPNKTMYGKDKWDGAVNEKIEREWLQEKSKPRYAKLTTFRGVIKFKKLTQKIENEYQQIKDEKRGKILKNEMGIELNDQEISPFQKALNRVLEGGVRNRHEIGGIAFGMGISEDALCNKLTRELKKMNKPAVLSHYYWDKKAKSKEIEDLSIS